MSTQRARLPEALPAHFTHEGPRAGVHGHVAGQIVVRVKHLTRRKKDNNNKINKDNNNA